MTGVTGALRERILAELAKSVQSAPQTRLSIPTQASVGRNSHAASINDFNLQLKQQPWYQDFIRQAGFEGRPVQLSHAQRDQLEQLIIRQGGVPPNAFNDMQIDPAGNLNTEHG